MYADWTAKTYHSADTRLMTKTGTEVFVLPLPNNPTSRLPTPGAETLRNRTIPDSSCFRGRRDGLKEVADRFVVVLKGKYHPADLQQKLIDAGKLDHQATEVSSIPTGRSEKRELRRAPP